MAGSVDVGQIVAGKYRVERILGRGGMGVVVAARHLTLNQLRAIKFMRTISLTSRDSVERFQREAFVLASVTSKHVARVDDVGSLPDGTLYIVMEYLEGKDLKQVVGETGLPPVGQAVRYLLQACEGVETTHRAGIVHRDLKPSNMFLANQQDGEPIIKILDFGIAKLRRTEHGGDDLTQTHGMIGSPPYMAPEQARSAKDADSRSDIWSLGASLFQLLCGRVPFQADSMAEILAMIISDPVPQLRDHAPWLPFGLPEVVQRCLEKDPDKRFQTADQLSAALHRFADVETVPPIEELVTKPVKRLPRKTTSGGTNTKRDGADLSDTESLTDVTARGPDTSAALMSMTELVSPNAMPPVGPKQATRRSAMLGVTFLLAATLVIAAIAWKFHASAPAAARPEIAPAIPVDADRTDPTPVAPEPTPVEPAAHRDAGISAKPALSSPDAALQPGDNGQPARTTRQGDERTSNKPSRPDRTGSKTKSSKDAGVFNGVD